ncbi:MAG TPA: hypothetical protein VJ999_11420 [Candidatus Sulfotelmatobacter sp.]|nr:hypothetical protein [Candidatus Sulfotelmatobacter sp.]
MPIPQGATLQPLDQQAQQPPGFFKRLGQSLGVPTSMQELQAAQPSLAEGLGGPAVTAGKMLWNYGKNTVKGFQDAYQDVKEGGQNIAEGQPVLPNLIGKGFGAGVRAGINAIPFLGPAINTAGEDVTAGNYRGAAGGLTGVTAQAALPFLAERGSAALNKLRAPLGDTVSQPRGTIPAESASPAELQAYADQNSIPLNAAQATEHNLPRNLQSAGERATVGGTAVKQQIKASQAAVTQHAQDLMDSFSPNTPDLATAGSAIKQNVSAALDREIAASRQDYADVDQRAAGTQVDLTPLKQTAAKILNDTSFVRKASALDQRRAASILQDIGNLPDAGTFSDAQQVRSALLDASRSPDLAISNQAQGWIKQLTGSVDGEMMNAANSKPGLTPVFRLANDHWTKLQEDFNSPRSPLAQILQEPDPSKVPQKLVQRGQIGGSPYNAQLLDRYGIDKGPIKWTIAGDLLQKNFGLSGGKTLGGYSDAFLQSVFSPQELSALYKTGAIARSVGLNTNPSGTSAVMGAMSDIQKPIRSLAPKAAAAGLTTSPAFNQRMMTPGQPPFRSPVPVAPSPLPRKNRFETNSDIFDEDTMDRLNGRL